MALKFTVLIDTRKGLDIIYIILRLLIFQYTSNKAVSDGVVSYHIDHFVSARIAKYSCGIRAAIPYVASDREHSARRHLNYIGLDGPSMISEHFSVILSKVGLSSLS